MQETSALYKQIIATEPHWFETYITVNGNTVNEDEIFSLDRSRPGMSQNYPSIGGALSSTLTLTILNPSFSIPKMAEIKVYYRAVCGKTSGSDSYLVNGVVSGGDMSMSGDTLVLPNATLSNGIVTFGSSSTTTKVSEWIKAGTYYIDTRAHNQSYNGIDTLDITAFDAMMKAEKDYPDTTHDWPCPDTFVVAEIASQIGVTVDSRTNQFLTARNMIELPSDLVMREVLERIAAMYCGNFVITAENKLLFVPLLGLDPEENITGNYLSPEGSTDALTFGNEGWYILV